jgi:hypothetical protein
MQFANLRLLPRLAVELNVRGFVQPYWAASGSKSVEVSPFVEGWLKFWRVRRLQPIAVPVGC